MLKAEDVRRIFTDPAFIPPASAHLGFEMLDFDLEAMTFEAAFTAKPEFLNPNGTVQGGIVTAFLDEAMSSAAVIATGLEAEVPTLEMKTSFLRPLFQGRCTARGRVVRLGRSFAFLEGELKNAEGKACATATATCVVRRG